jgi:hypothetical protein
MHGNLGPSSSHLELPQGTEVIHNPSVKERDEAIGFPDDSELFERHGRHFQLVGGSRRMAIEVTHFFERRKGAFKKEELVKDTTVYLLPEGTDLTEARRIGYRLLEDMRPNLDDESR